MTFKPNSPINQRGYFDFNPLNGRFFVFRKNAAAKAVVESAIDDLEKEKQLLLMKLEGEKDFLRRRETSEEIKRIEKIQELNTKQVPGLLLHGLENRIKGFNQEISQTSDLLDLAKIRERQKLCIEAFENRQEKISSHEGVLDAIDRIKSDDYLLQIIDNNRFDEVSIHLLTKSDLVSFFNEDLLDQLDVTQKRMIVSGFVESTLRPKEVDIEETEKEWSSYKGDTQNQINALKKEKDEITSELSDEGMDLDRKIQLKGRIAWIKEALPLMEEQLGFSGEWTSKRMIKKASEPSQSAVKKLPEDVRKKIKSYVEQAKFMRTLKINEYLNGKFDRIHKRFGGIKKAGILSKSTLEGERLIIDEKTVERRGLARDIDEFGKMLNFMQTPTDITKLKGLTLDPSVKISEYIRKFQDPEIFKQLSNNLDKFAVVLETSIDEMTEIQENRSAIEKEIKDSYRHIEKFLNLSPAQIAKITGKSEKSPSVTKGQMNVIKEFQGPRSAIGKEFANIKARLSKISLMDPEELQATRDEINCIKDKFGLPENFDELINKALDPNNEIAINTHKTIRSIEGAMDADTILAIVEKNLGKDHIIPVSNKTFLTEYKKYTPRGFMVFCQRGDEWKIIYDKSAVNDPNNFRKLKKQIVHELLHLEFEKSEDTRSNVRKEMIEGNEKWPEIREAFISYAKSVRKKAPTKKGWTDDDILSELYAMMNDIGHRHSNTSGPKGKLNNLLIEAGVSNSMKKIRGIKIDDVEKKIQGYESSPKPEEIVRGAEEGIEETDETTMKGVNLQEMEGGGYEDLKFKIDGNRKRLNEAKGNEHLGELAGATSLIKTMDRFNEETHDMNENYFQANPNAIMGDAINNRVEMVRKDLNKIENKLGEISAEAPNTEISPFRKLWNSTHFIAICDITQMFVNVKEFIKRRHDRKMADHAARLGMALFQNTDLGKEADARMQKAEMGEVQEWQSRYENKDAWSLIDEVKTLANGVDPSKDQFKAILRLLAKKGRIDWRSPELWTVLNKLQNSVKLIPNDPVLLHDPSHMDELLHKAIGEIWDDYDEFLTLKRTNDSGYEGEVKKYMSTCDAMQDVLTARLDNLLAAKRSGKNVDPMEYESILVYSIEKGKSFSENIMFHLMVGQAIGLLNPDRGMVLDKMMNNWPATQWIYNKKPPLSKQDYLDVCKKWFPNDFEAGSVSRSIKGPGDGAEFKNFFWTQVQNDKMVIQRVRKAAGEKDKWDHDWVRSILPAGDSESVRRYYAGRSGRKEAQETAIENVSVGLLQWLEENSKRPQSIDYRFQFARMAGCIAMSEGHLDGTAFYDGTKDILARSSETMESNIAREAFVGNHANWTVRQHRNKMKAFLDNVNPVFFRIFRNKIAYSDEEKKRLGEEAKQHLLQYYPTYSQKWETLRNIDDVFKNIDFIIRVFMSKEYMTDERLMEIITKMRG